MSLPWQTALTNAITDPSELLQLLELDLALLPAAQQAVKLFPLRVPRGFVARMNKGDVNDPLLKQVLPLGLELEETAGFSNDPLQEKSKNPVPGLLHKYQSRVLLTLTSACAINCRYCFRRYFSYSENNPGKAGWQKVVDYIAADPSINEVILSGGDPLVASDHYLAELIGKIETISHIKTLRIHSRLPIVLPERMTGEFINWLAGLRLQPVIVVHCNHPQELTAEVKQSLRALRQAGITVLNQAVLLRGINDSVEVLVGLSEELWSVGALPYYLHLLDRVQGIAHFEVDEENARQLMLAVMERLPGYLVPKLVREVAGMAMKAPIEIAIA